MSPQLTPSEFELARRIAAERDAGRDEHGRWPALDAVRGLAILVMVLDHVWILTVGPELDPVRWFTRLAMPVFFLLGGHLFRRLTWRHAVIAALGLVLPVVVPWIDSPNVLVWYALSCLVLAVCSWRGLPPWVVIAVALTLAAQDLLPERGAGYSGWCLVALAALGTVVPRSAFSWAAAAPAWVAAMGCRPLSWYVGHLLVLQLVAVVA